MKSVDDILRIVRPHRLYTTARTVARPDGSALVVSDMLGFEPEGGGGEAILAEGTLWDSLRTELGEEGAERVDRWTTKGTGELLVTGRAYAGAGASSVEPALRARLLSPDERRTLVDRDGIAAAELHDEAGLTDEQHAASDPWDVQRARPEQRLKERFFEGGEWLDLTGMHPSEPAQRLRVPEVRARTFSLRRDGRFVEEPMRFDTVRVFPHARRGVAIYRTSLGVADERASDVQALVTGLERHGAPRPPEYYRELLERAAHERARPFVHYDGELLPEPLRPCRTCRHHVDPSAPPHVARLLPRAPAAGSPPEWRCGLHTPEDLERRGWRFDRHDVPWQKSFGCESYEPRVAAQPEEPLPAAAPTLRTGSASHAPRALGAADAAGPGAAAAAAAAVPPDAAAAAALQSRDAGGGGRARARAARGPTLAEGTLAAVAQRPLAPPRRGEKDELDFHLESQAFSTAGLEAYRFAGREVLGAPFAFTVDLVTKGAPLDDEAVVGAEVTLVTEWSLSREVVRRVHGIVSRVERQVDSRHAAQNYRLHLVPRFFRLSLTTTQEIFLELNIVDVITQKLERAGFQAGSDFEWRLSETYPTREFITQYKESDLAFVSRLCEHDGITLWIEHGETDRLILCDEPDAFQKLEPIALRTSGDRRDVYRLTVESALTTHDFEAHDYNYRAPHVPLRERQALAAGHAGVVIEYGGHPKTPEEAQRQARLRAEEHDARRVTCRVESDCPWLFAGARFELDGDHGLASPELLVTSIEHAGSRPVLLGGGDAAARSYVNTFTTARAALPYRAPRVTPRPRIAGLVNAIIEHDLAKGHEYWAKIDAWGRYSVRFLFDAANHPTLQSRWCRMLQPHAGPNYGMHMPLRPGIEVAIAFMEGDPDRPIIVGSVPNPVTPSPVTRANHRTHAVKTVSGCHIEIYDAPEPGG